MRANRVDRNQPEIVAHLRACGAFVQPLNAVKDGCPDILVVFGGEVYLMEIKDGDKPPSARKLTPDELEWHRQARARGYEVAVVLGVVDALEAVGLAPVI